MDMALMTRRVGTIVDDGYFFLKENSMAFVDESESYCSKEWGCIVETCDSFSSHFHVCKTRFKTTNWLCVKHKECQCGDCQNLKGKNGGFNLLPTRKQAKTYIYKCQGLLREI